MGLITSDTKVLVTGGLGFCGAALIRSLLEKYNGIKIISIDSMLAGSDTRRLDNVEYINGHTSDIKNIMKDKTVPDIIFHFGEYSRIAQSFDDVQLCLDSNLAGTYNILIYCKENNIRLIYSGSSSKFGNGGRDENLNPYAWSKAKNVELIKNFGNWFNLKYNITYFYNVYGPGQISNGRYATVIGKWETLYSNGQPLTIVKPGTQTRDFTHIEDIINGVILVAEKGVNCQEYLLGSGKNYSMIEIAKMFKCPIEYVESLKGERENSIADNSKAKELGWEIKHNIEDYISEFINNQP